MDKTSGLFKLCIIIKETTTARFKAGESLWLPQLDKYAIPQHRAPL